MKAMKFMGKTALVGVYGLAALFAIYWFNLDNKLIFYCVRPVLNRIYDNQKRDVKL